ncbi:hypothetical protein [Sanguibacter sp. HDW7]|uniref:hypothetical protein n=1 Tax=Sanguibacter sp. HDW7 TaxID=2714931 RepID=UPI00140E7422|nr:hypothetical protein [Sanguibacter sp. HDW7]QIK82991.1 hypothetical protein G7063_04630 [Sanguibacter sp. HDW7]
MAARKAQDAPAPEAPEVVTPEAEVVTPEVTDPEVPTTEPADAEPVEVEVHSPATDFTGDVLGVTFTKGTAHTSDPVALAYFTRRGYTVAPEA